MLQVYVFNSAKKIPRTSKTESCWHAVQLIVKNMRNTKHRRERKNWVKWRFERRLRLSELSQLTNTRGQGGVGVSQRQTLVTSPSRGAPCCAKDSARPGAQQRPFQFPPPAACERLTSSFSSIIQFTPWAGRVCAQMVWRCASRERNGSDPSGGEAELASETGRLMNVWLMKETATTTKK